MQQECSLEIIPEDLTGVTSMREGRSPSMNMNADAHIRVVLEVFAAIEQRDAARFQAHTHPGVTICWPPSLPWNAGVPGRPDEDGQHALSWLEVWAPLQPTAAERQIGRASCRERV